MENSFLLGYLSTVYSMGSKILSALEDVLVRLAVMGFGISLALIALFILLAVNIDSLLAKIGI